MKSNIPLAISAALLPCIVVNAQENSDTGITNEELASYGLNLTEFEYVRTSESPADFGGLENQDDTDQLWLDAAVFEYELATSHSSEKATSSHGYHPYLICSTYPNSSGVERDQKVEALFQNTPNVSASHYYTGGNLFHNDDYISCGIVRTYGDTIRMVYEANPDADESMTANPLSSSMKMVENTVEILKSWFEEEESGDIISIGSEGNDNTIQVKILGLRMVLCPGVQDFDNVSDVNDTLIEDAIRDFVTENGGETVANHSFYHHRVGGGDGDDAVHTERMAAWSAAVSNVTSWTKEDGSNQCLDSVIKNNMDFSVKGQTVSVVASMSFWETDALLEELGFSEEELETCIWYLTYGLAVDPMVCSLEPKTEVQTLCKDGTSDLSKCPPTPPTSSSSRTTTWTGSSLLWMNNAVGLMMTVLVSVVGGVIML